MNCKSLVLSIGVLLYVNCTCTCVFDDFGSLNSGSILGVVVKSLCIFIFVLCCVCVDKFIELKICLYKWVFLLLNFVDSLYVFFEVRKRKNLFIVTRVCFVLLFMVICGVLIILILLFFIVVLLFFLYLNVCSGKCMLFFVVIYSSRTSVYVRRRRYAFTGMSVLVEFFVRLNFIVMFFLILIICVNCYVDGILCMILMILLARKSFVRISSRGGIGCATYVIFVGCILCMVNWFCVGIVVILFF